MTFRFLNIILLCQDRWQIAKCQNLINPEKQEINILSVWARLIMTFRPPTDAEEAAQNTTSLNCPVRIFCIFVFISILFQYFIIRILNIILLPTLTGRQFPVRVRPNRSFGALRECIFTILRIIGYYQLVKLLTLDIQNGIKCTTKDQRT